MTLYSDFTGEDFLRVLWTSGRVIKTAAVVAPGCRRRYLGRFLDGLGAEAATPCHGRR